MSFLEVGETAVIEDGKEYACYANIPCEGKRYAFLVNIKDKNEKLIVEQRTNLGELELEIISDGELKEKLMDLFLKKISSMKIN